MAKLDKSKPVRKDWENLKPGDIVFDSCISGLGSGGLNYGIGEVVREITDKFIITENGGKWDVDSKNHIGYPSGYYLAGFQSPTDDPDPETKIELPKKAEQPPLGVIPEEFWIEDRVRELRRAIIEYANTYRMVHPEWVDEYNRLLKQLNDKKD